MVPGSMVAQEALRTAVSADRALQAPAPQSARGDGGLYWGPVQFSAGASLALEYDDNIQAGSVGPDLEFSGRESLLFGATAHCGAVGADLYRLAPGRDSAGGGP